MRASEGPKTHATMERLRALLARADYETPQAMLHWLLLGPWQGRRKLVARLGREANDPIDELLNAAMAYAAGNVPSLTGFLQWFDAGEGELKREAGKNEGLVRVMTVHGSKGLQAPIVILADAADDPDASPVRGLEVTESVLGETRKVPLPPLRKEEKAGPVREAEAQAAREEREEHWRLLYVAMTRAEEALFVTGSLGGRRKEIPPESWYAMLEPLFGTEEWIADPLWEGRRQLGAPAPAPAAGATPEASRRARCCPPCCFSRSAPNRARRALAPSAMGEDDARSADPAGTGRAAGGAAGHAGPQADRAPARTAARAPP
jgi:ATP-dependent helicase/nuclease subunit A